MNKLTHFTLLLLFPLYLSAQEDDVSEVLDRWHQAAAEANFETYFSLMTENGVFLGTDATENWQNTEFRTFSKPYFDKGRAWTFHPVERNIYFSENDELAWFDELLDTRMGLCRGSGVLQRTGEGWKIAHYVLSIAVPNDRVDALVSLKKEQDSLLTIKLREAYQGKD